MVVTCVGPRVSGMLIIGLLLRNIPGIKFVGENIDSKWGSTLRYDFHLKQNIFTVKKWKDVQKDVTQTTRNDIMVPD